MDKIFMLPGFLFDMDGVLVDTEDLHWEAWKKLQKESPQLVMSHAEFKKGFGKTNDHILRELLPSASIEERNRLGHRKEELLRQVAVGKVTLLPGMEPFLQEIVKARHPRIIASSTPIANLEFYLAQTPLGRYFDAYASAEEVARGKPYPDVFLEAAKRLKLAPSDCIVLEDSPAGLQAGRDAGAFVIALATSHPAQSLRNYDLLFPSPAELELTHIVAKWKAWRHDK